MPSVVKLRVVAARGLPLNDKNGFDSFVSVSMGDIGNARTRTVHCTSSPVWDERFRMEVANDSDLLDTPLKIELYTDNDSVALGSLLLDLSVLLVNKDSKYDGWMPLYDTLRGAQGQLWTTVKVLFVEELNPLRQSSVGVLFFSIRAPPQTQKYTLESLYGLVEDLTVVHDPEYDWKEKFRSARASNEARRHLLQITSMQTRMRVGRKVLNQGGNAVLGYTEFIDLEGDETHKICVRSIGTGVRLGKPEESVKNEHKRFDLRSNLDSTNPDVVSDEIPQEPNISSINKTTCFNTRTLSKISKKKLNQSSIPVNSSSELWVQAWKKPILNTSLSTGAISPNNTLKNLQLEMTSRIRKGKTCLEILTLNRLSLNISFSYGGAVGARGVKLLTSRTSQSERIGWWQELRDELKNHANQLNCDCVIGYTENISIHGDLVVLSVSGTAISTWNHHRGAMIAAQSIIDKNISTETLHIRKADKTYFMKDPKKKIENENIIRACSLVHLPTEMVGIPDKKGRISSVLMDSSGNIHASVKCGMCDDGFVPPILLATTECPEGMPVVGEGTLVEARVCRSKRKASGEAQAIQVSEILPFLDLELHRQLVYKIKLLGMNAAFGLSINLSVGSMVMVAVATATAVFLRPLPPPPVLAIRLPQSTSDDTSRGEQLQNQLHDISLSNADKFDKLLNIKGEQYAASFDYSTDDLIQMSKQFSQKNEPKKNEKQSNTAQNDNLVSTESDHDGLLSLVSSALNQKDVPVFIFEVDDQMDEELIESLFDDPEASGSCMLTSTDYPLGAVADSIQSHRFPSGPETTQSARDTKLDLQCPFVYAVRRFDLSEQHTCNEMLSSIVFKVLLQGIWPCCLSNLHWRLSLVKDDLVEILLTAQSLKIKSKRPDMRSNIATENLSLLPQFLSEPEVLINNTREDWQRQRYARARSDGIIKRVQRRLRHRQESKPLYLRDAPEHVPPRYATSDTILVTSLTSLPSTEIIKYVGLVNLHLIKETTNIKELEIFYQEVLTDSLYMARAHVKALGGNALLGFRISLFRIQESSASAYAAVCVCGDAVKT
eukprot:GHVL01028142.1.p1 GENE.GHVL01028142.1~~GHVL01028142.1.p1  ORF type:complete len:1061 (+),score=215.87 GHVL01028142.1:133-3315(+)